MAIILGTNARLEVGNSFGATAAVDSISKASTGVVSFGTNTHGLSAGDVVVLEVEGMAELNGQACRIANTTTNTFDLEGIDTTNYGTFTSGTAKEVTAWETLGNAQSIEAEQQAPVRIDVTTLLDTEKQYIFGLPDSPQITINGLADPLGTANARIATLSRSNTQSPLRATFGGGSGPVMLANGYWAGGDGFSLASNEVARTRYDFTQTRRRVFYAS